MNRLRLLVLEHHDFQRSVAVNTLLGMGCLDVLEASDGQEALSLLQHQGGVDIAVCDLHMAGMDGLTFLTRAREAGLVRAVIISRELPEDVLYTVERIVTLQGLALLGSMGKPVLAELLGSLLSAYLLSEQAGAIQPAISGQQPSEKAIRQGIARQEFCAWLQPKFQLRSGEIHGAEVLVRWQQGEGRLLSPAAFLPAVEQYGLLNEVFFSLFEQGLRLQRFMQSRGKTFKLAFNVDVTQLSCAQFVDQVQSVLSRHGASPCGLTFELTETGLLQAPGVCMTNMVRLRMLGCELSIDDFGVGYSSLERLCQMPFNEVKLDAGFIRNFQQKRSVAVIKGVLDLARALNMHVIAEGIETVEQLHCLVELGCQLGQGYLFARPMSAAQLMTWEFEGDQSIWRNRFSATGP